MMRAFEAAALRRARDRLLRADTEPHLAQAEVHQRLGRALQGTTVARVQAPRVWESLETYRRWVRLWGYDAYEDLIGDAMACPTADAFERGVCATFASLGEERYLPFTKAHLRHVRAFDAALLASVHEGEQGSSARTFVATPTAPPRHTVGGALLGTAYAVMLARAPFWLRRRLLPSRETLLITEASARREAMRTSLVEGGAAAVTGDAGCFAQLVRELVDDESSAAIRSALRELRVAAWSGEVAPRDRALLDEHLHPQYVTRRTVDSAVGPLGIEGDAPGQFRAALGQSLFVFTPPHDPGDRRFAWELQDGREYDIYVGSFAGPQGYATGQRVQVVSRAPLRFEIVSRAASDCATGAPSAATERYAPESRPRAAVA